MRIIVVAWKVRSAGVVVSSAREEVGAFLDVAQVGGAGDEDPARRGDMRDGRLMPQTRADRLRVAVEIGNGDVVETGYPAHRRFLCV
ncbi:hypothetical protein [Alterinioella nitratireducens]|uniref:hypothetical protein n=1 Tax=Alterinioella nitratireducens TaxID=2735915 RepID=UPI004059E69C